MKIIELESTDSTSDYALRIIAEKSGPQLPFAVIARRQTQGRGRSGRTWQSPEGGIYATLVLEGGAFPQAQLGLLPLLVACAVAGWLRATFSIRITIKWPNDLLFAGAKLGGILCESSVQGQEWGPLLIGVGLNVRAGPPVAEQTSVGIEEILGGEPISDIAVLGRSFVAYLNIALADPKLLERYSQFGIEPGQLWKDTRGNYARVAALGPEGHLELEDLVTGTKHNLSSVRHEWQWLYQLAEAQTLLLADVGNSLVKILVTHYGNEEGKPQILRFSLKDDEIVSLENSVRFMKELKLPSGWPVHAIAVNDKLQERFAAFLERLGFRLVLVPKRPLRVRFDRYRFEELGADRVALVEAAHAQWPLQNLIVVSAGTAVTVEVLTKHGVYEGGYILPGLQTKLTALHQRTARLPAIQLHEIDAAALAEAGLLGNDTRSAMVRGALRETSLALSGLRSELKTRYGEDEWKIVCTGGDGAILSSLLDAAFRPQLILEGVAAMALGGTLPVKPAGLRSAEPLSVHR